LLDQLRHALRVRHYSRRTEECYVDWVRRFILFHGKRLPMDLGGPPRDRLPDVAGGPGPRRGQHAEPGPQRAGVPGPASPRTRPEPARPRPCPVAVPHSVTAARATAPGPVPRCGRVPWPAI